MTFEANKDQLKGPDVIKPGPPGAFTLRPLKLSRSTVLEPLRYTGAGEPDVSLEDSPIVLLVEDDKARVFTLHTRRPKSGAR